MFNNQGHMGDALTEAMAAAARGEVPVGAVLVNASGSVICKAGNSVLARNDPTAHAEMEVIRKGCQILGSSRLVDCDLYVTLEPCPMCAQAISFARVRRLYYGASDSKGGGVEHGPTIFGQPGCNHRPHVFGGIGEVYSAALLKSFFLERRGGLSR